MCDGHLVEISKSHSVNSRSLPLREGRVKLNTWGMAFKYPQWKSYEDSISFESLCCGDG